MGIHRPDGLHAMSRFLIPVKLFVQPDHYVFRMLYSQGIPLDELEIGASADRRIRARFGASSRDNYYLFRGTPTRLWLDYAFENLFGMTERLCSQNGGSLLRNDRGKTAHTQEFLPRALFERFNIEVLATTDSPLDTLEDHKAVRESGWKGRIVPTFRPDPVVDPEISGFRGKCCGDWKLDRRRYGIVAWISAGAACGGAYFKLLGATATDHGHPTAMTADLGETRAARLFEQDLEGHGLRSRP